MSKRFYPTSDEDDRGAVCDASGEEYDTCIKCGVEVPSSLINWAGACDGCVMDLAQ